jgi:uncharacterized protein
LSHQLPWELVRSIEPGTTERMTLRFSDHLLEGIEIPCIVVRGVNDGPDLAVVAGVHGGEYPGPAAAIRLARELDPASLSGNLVIVPVANQTAFWQRSAFVTPEDGKNLNRVFPGNPHGSFSQVLACRFFDAVVRPADTLIDLHSGDIFESLSPFSGFYDVEDEGLRKRSESIARAFDVPSICRYPAPSEDHGSLTSSAVHAGVAPVIVEVGGNGLLTEDDEQIVFDGLVNGLRAIGALEGQVQPTSPVWFEPVAGVEAGQDGLWRPEVALNQQVREGERLGVMMNQFGDVLAEFSAPSDGQVVFFMTCLPVSAGEPLVALGRPVS